MRVVVTGASGNLGTSILGTLGADERVSEILGLCRRPPDLPLAKVKWQSRDVVQENLSEAMAGADAVIHLAWAIQPSHDEAALHRTNVIGSERVFSTAIDAGVSTIIHLSSLATYAPGPKEPPVDESWPATGIRTSAYARNKAEVEARVKQLTDEHPDTRFVTFRPGLMLKREAAVGQRKLFLGRLPLFPGRPLPIIPKTEGLRFPVVHASDAADAVVAAIFRDVRGAFNLAASPALDSALLAKAAGAPLLPVPPLALRAAADLTWRLHLQPTDPGWIDILLQTPLLDCGRAERELDWRPAVPADHAFAELVQGLKDDVGFATPPLRAE